MKRNWQRQFVFHIITRISITAPTTSLLSRWLLLEQRLCLSSQMSCVLTVWGCISICLWRRFVFLILIKKNIFGSLKKIVINCNRHNRTAFYFPSAKRGITSLFACLFAYFIWAALLFCLCCCRRRCCWCCRCCCCCCCFYCYCCCFLSSTHFPGWGKDLCVLFNWIVTVFQLKLPDHLEKIVWKMF